VRNGPAISIRRKMATQTVSDQLMSSLSAQGPGSLADREYKRLLASTGASKKTLSDMYKLAIEKIRIVGQK
jgi:hypothetical protein